ncbi:MAG: hemerythrin domain-containing protein, partial [Calditrichia bacterium]
GAMNIFDVIEDHHDELRELFKKVKKDPSQFDKLKKNLRVHHENEEAILLNVLKENDEVRDEALESIEEHRNIEMMLVDLEDFPKDHERWKVKLGILQEFTEHHMEEEEEDLFEDGEDILPEDEQEEMGKKFQERKNEQLKVL